MGAGIALVEIVTGKARGLGLKEERLAWPFQRHRVGLSEQED